MIKTLFLVLAAVMSIAVVAGCSKGYESQQSVNGISITLAADRYPLVKGENTVSIKVADQAGKALTDAAVAVRLYMPPMPGMAPMDSKTQAVVSGDKYSATVNSPMEGGWKVDVTVTQPGKNAITATFNVDAR